MSEEKRIGLIAVVFLVFYVFGFSLKFILEENRNEQDKMIPLTKASKLI